MIDIKFLNERAVVATFDRLPRRLMDRLEATMTSLIERVAAAQRAAAPRRTGRLASQVGNVFVDRGVDSVRARSTVIAPTGWQYGKAGALEYGAPGRRGRFMVKEHKRRGRGIGMETLVDRYYRTQNLLERRYIRGPFEAMQGEIQSELQDAVTDAFSDIEAA